jgi:deazaflavin-dependent oxidoreductase (nitroreductase family)
MTIAQFMGDLDELVHWVRKRVGAEKVAILGHSWGSALGVLYAARFPEKVAVYVGAAQVGDWAAGESASYSQALAQAKRRGQRRAVSKLLAIGPPPHTPKNLFAERTLALRVAGQLGPKSIWNAARAALGVRESSVLELPKTMRGFRFTLDAMWAEVSRLNLIKAAPELKIPVFFFLGRKDPWIPPQVSVAYFDALTALSKELVWFEQSGHEPFVDEAEKFNSAMAERVRPIAANRSPTTRSDSTNADPAEQRLPLRFLYRDWHPTRLGRWANQFTGWWVGLGLAPWIMGVLEVSGRRSGKRRSTPVVIARVEGKSYLVSMLGLGSDWVKNVEAAHGDAVIRQGRRRHVHLVAVPPAERAAILREYVRVASSGRHHFPLPVGAPLSAFAEIAGRYPVFRIDSPS